MRLAVLWIQRQRLAEILLGLGGQAHVVVNISPIHITHGHLGINRQGARELVDRRLLLVIVRVHVPGNQIQVAIILQNRLIALCDLHRFVEPLEEQKIIGQIVDRFAILRELGNHLIAEICRFGVVPGHRQIPLMLAHNLRILSHRLRSSRQPLLGLRGLVGFERRVHRPGNNQGIARRPFESLFVTLLRFRKLSGRAIQITQG